MHDATPAAPVHTPQSYATCSFREKRFAAGDFKAAHTTEANGGFQPDSSPSISRLTDGRSARVRQAAELSREASIASLKHTQGDVLRALHNELASWRLDTGLLDHLVWEYAAFRRVALSLSVSAPC